MIDVRSAKSRTRSSKKDLSSAFAKDMFLLAKHIRRERLRAVAGSQDLGVPLAEYAASLRFQTSALTLTGEDRESHDKIHPHDTVMQDGHQIQDQRNGGACRDRTDDLKLAKLPLSQLS
jgi:hypothetical protein